MKKHWLKVAASLAAISIMMVTAFANINGPSSEKFFSSNSDMYDKQAIREVVDNWVIWRDSGDWERFRSLWADDGRMMATFFQGSYSDFIKLGKEGMQKGLNVLHFQGGNSIDLAGNRAISQTKVIISQRAKMDGYLVDVVCTGRFYDFFEKRNGKWLIVLRQPIYEKDRMDVVDPDPAKPLKLDQSLLLSFPEGYRHLAYLQTKAGYKVKKDQPGLKGPEVEALYALGKKWLAGGPLEKQLNLINFHHKLYGYTKE
jgi:hypothetical protein